MINRSLAFYRDLLGWPVAIPPIRYRGVGFRGGVGTRHQDLALMEVGRQEPGTHGLASVCTTSVSRSATPMTTSGPYFNGSASDPTSPPSPGYIHSLYAIPGSDWTDPKVLNEAPHRPLRL